MSFLNDEWESEHTWPKQVDHFDIGTKAKRASGEGRRRVLEVLSKKTHGLYEWNSDLRFKVGRFIVDVQDPNKDNIPYCKLLKCSRCRRTLCKGLVMPLRLRGDMATIWRKDVVARVHKRNVSRPLAWVDLGDHNGDHYVAVMTMVVADCSVAHGPGAHNSRWVGGEGILMSSFTNSHYKTWLICSEGYLTEREGVG